MKTSTIDYISSANKDANLLSRACLARKLQLTTRQCDKILKENALEPIAESIAGRGKMTFFNQDTLDFLRKKV